MSSNVLRESDQARDGSGGIADRQLAGQTPDRLRRTLPLQFQMTDQRATGAKHTFVLFGGDASEVAWTNVAAPLAKRFVLVSQFMTQQQRLVDQEETTL